MPVFRTTPIIAKQSSGLGSHSVGKLHRASEGRHSSQYRLTRRLPSEARHPVIQSGKLELPTVHAVLVHEHASGIEELCSDVRYNEESAPAEHDEIAARARLLDQAFARPAAPVREFQDQAAPPPPHQHQGPKRNKAAFLERANMPRLSKQLLQRSRSGQVTTAVLTQHGPLSARRKLRRAKWRQMTSSSRTCRDSRTNEGLGMQLNFRRYHRLCQRQDVSPQASLLSLKSIQSEAAQIVRAGRQSNGSRSAVDILLGGQDYGLLQREHEVALVKAMQLGWAVQKEVTNSQTRQSRQRSAQSDIEGISADERTALARGAEAMQILVHANIKLVLKVAHKFGWDPNLQFEDYVMAGMEGLVTGLLKFDPGRGVKLSTYLVHWIKNSVSSAIAVHANIIKTPRHHQYAILQLKKLRNKLTGSLQRAPTYAELSSASKLPAKSLALLLKLEHRRQMPCDKLSNNEESSDTLLSHTLEEAEEPLRMLMLEETLENALQTLRPKHFRVMTQLYDFANGTCPNHREVGAALGCSQRRVGQMQKYSLQKLRTSCCEDLSRIAMDHAVPAS